MQTRTWAEGIANAIKGGDPVGLQGPGHYGPGWGIDYREHWRSYVTGKSGPGRWWMYVVTDRDASSGFYGYSGHVWSGVGEAGSPVIRIVSQQDDLTGAEVGTAVGMYAPRSAFAGGFPWHDLVPPPSGNVIGVGWYYSEGGRQDWAAYPGTAGQPYLGLTDPGNCKFYWGTKIAYTPSDDTDEPLGAVPTSGGGDDTPPDLDDPGDPGDDGGTDCGFSFTDPSSWAGAGICQLVKAIASVVDWLGKIFGVLGSILGVLGDLAGTIADAIADAIAAAFGTLGDVLTALFVPDENPFADFKSDMDDSYEDSSASDWGDALQGYAEPGGSGAGSRGIASSSGCEGPAVTWDGFAKVGMPATWHPLAACSGTASDMAYWCHLLLTLLIVVGGGVKIIEMFMTQLGILKNTHTLTAFDWSGPNSGRK